MDSEQAASPTQRPRWRIILPRSVGFGGGFAVVAAEQQRVTALDLVRVKRVVQFPFKKPVSQDQSRAIVPSRP